VTAERRRSHAEEIAFSLGDQKALERFTSARTYLQQHLVVKRVIPNGRDFLFSGPGHDLQTALKDLVEIEHRASRFLLFDYAQIDDYFLLRVVGGGEYQETIDTYFD
jgi:hypothetical protein